MEGNVSKLEVGRGKWEDNFYNYWRTFAMRTYVQETRSRFIKARQVVYLIDRINDKGTFEILSSKTKKPSLSSRLAQRTGCKNDEVIK